MLTNSIALPGDQRAPSDSAPAMSETLVDIAIAAKIAAASARTECETLDLIPVMAETADEIPAAARIVVTVPPSAQAPSLAGRVVQRAMTNSPGIAKLAMDFALSVALVILAAPVVLLTALAVKLSSRGPVFYSQIRVGRGGRPFTIYKVRTMIHDCESLTGARWSTAGDPRITPIGNFLRRRHLDELPQPCNISHGHMSQVGPRPE